MASKSILVLIALLATVMLITSDVVAAAETIDAETVGDDVSAEAYGKKYCCGGWYHGYCKKWCYKSNKHCCGGWYHGYCKKWCY